MTNLKEHGQNLEKIFFPEEDDENFSTFIENQQKDKDDAEALRSLSGITSKSILDNAIKLGINSTTFSALALIPLLKVAWADRLCDQKESLIILKFAKEHGIQENSPAYQLLNSWGQKSINPNLFIAWKSYVMFLQETLTQVELNEFKNEIIGKARKVAKASGGFLGIGSISHSEEDILLELEQCFSKKET